MKRIAILLLSVVFWLTALPWGAVSAAMDGNIIINGDFEDGKTGWSCNSGTADIVSDAYSGTGALQLTNPSAWGEAAVQTVNVTTHTEYTLMWYSKRVSGRGAFSLIPMDPSNWSNLSATGQNWMNETSGNWVKNEISFNTGYSTQVFLKITAEMANAGSIIMDDITMIPVGWQPPAEPDVSSENMLINGDFETGDNTGWDNLWGNNTLTMVSGHLGSYALHVDANMWTHVRQQVDVEPNTDYVITGWYKNVTDMTLLVKDQNDSMNMQQGHMNGGADWTQITVEVNSGDNWQLYVGLMGNASNSEGIFDDFTMYPKGYVPDQPEDPAVGPAVANGDFETGDETGWTVFQGTAVKAEAKHNGSYGLHLIGDGGWGGMAFQDVPVQSGVEYTITMWMKTLSNGVIIQIKDGESWGDTLASHWFTATDWTQVTFTVTPTTNMLHINFCGGGNGIAESAYLDDVTVTAASDTPDDTDSPTGLIFNGDFETGDFTGWENLWDRNIVWMVEGHESNYAVSIEADLWTRFDQKVAVKPNTDYVITGWYKGVYDMELIVKDGADTRDLYYTPLVNGSDAWTQVGLKIHSGSETSLIISLIGYGDGAVGTFDDFSMFAAEDLPDEPLDPTVNRIHNGDFSDGAEGWTLGEGTSLEIDYAYSALPAMRLRGYAEYQPAMSQTVTVEPYTNYTLSFYARNVQSAYYWLAYITDADTGTQLAQTWFYPWYDWEKICLDFYSESATNVTVTFCPETYYSGDCIVDDVQMYQQGYEPPETPVTPIMPMTLTSCGAENNRPMSDDVNLLDNGSFEAPGGQWDVDTFCTEHVSVVEDTTTKWGNRSLYFDTSALTEAAETKTLFTVEVQPHTEYVFSVWVKGDFLSEDNRGRATIGVGNSYGQFLSTRDVLFMDGTRQIVPTAWDNQWHLRSVQFNTQNHTAVSIALAGWGSQMWVDDMALFEVGNGMKYTSANMGGNVEVNYNTEHTACRDEDSLIPDPAMKTADAAGFWAESDGWRNGFMSFVDGAMKYTSTGDNAATYTIKWVDVEPYTDYTFSLDLKILEDGSGRIALLDSKKLDKVEFFSISFDSYDYTDGGNTGWRTVSCTFNSDAYDRIGIAFVDNGGEVLLDNMRLFKTTDGMAAAMGDINGDGTVNTRDVGLFQRYLNGWDVVILTEVADVNADGKVNVQDIAVLQRYLCGWDIRLGG